MIPKALINSTLPQINDVQQAHANAPEFVTLRNFFDFNDGFGHEKRQRNNGWRVIGGGCAFSAIWFAVLPTRAAPALRFRLRRIAFNQ